MGYFNLQLNTGVQCNSIFFNADFFFLLQSSFIVYVLVHIHVIINHNYIVAAKIIVLQYNIKQAAHTFELEVVS